MDLTETHVEVCLKKNTIQPPQSISARIIELFKNNTLRLENAKNSYLSCSFDASLSSDVIFIRVDKSEGKGDPYFQLHLFHLYQDEESTSTSRYDSEEPIFVVMELPSAKLDGLWDTLMFEGEIKPNLLTFVGTTLLFSDKKIDPYIISWNKVVLFHGPPGTGKTSLCKALAQKLAIRFSDRYKHTKLVEINAQGLFSKYFSESGKLVVKVFDKIKSLCDNKDCLVCLLIDEVESIAAARKAIMNGSEPLDSIRVVNAVLTQIDCLKIYNNIVILTTSNLSTSLDLAFVDRADIKQYIGNPSLNARYSILQSCINELMRVQIITPPDSFLDISSIEIIGSRSGQNLTSMPSFHLYHIAKQCENFSGRRLRKLPFLAHAKYIKGCLRKKPPLSTLLTLLRDKKQAFTTFLVHLKKWSQKMWSLNK